MIIHDPPYAFFERFSAEIDEQPNGLLCQPQISEQLLAMNRRQSFDGLNLNNQSVIDQQIDLECPVKSNPVKLNIDGYLARNSVSHLVQPTS